MTLLKAIECHKKNLVFALLRKQGQQLTDLWGLTWIPQFSSAAHITAPNPDSLSLSGSLNLHKTTKVLLFHVTVSLNSLQTKLVLTVCKNMTSIVGHQQWWFHSYPDCRVKVVTHLWSGSSRVSSHSQSTLQGLFWLLCSCWVVVMIIKATQRFCVLCLIKVFKWHVLCNL